jgi:hypothetical protein
VIVVLALMPHVEDVDRVLVFILKKREISGVVKRHDELP